MKSAVLTPAASSPVQKIAQRVHEISSIPDVALRVIEVTNDPGAGAQELKTVMEHDASLSARVLRLVNSAAYGMRSQVTNLQMAVAYLGFRQIRNLALTASISGVFRSEEKLGTYSRIGLWRHLVSVGVAARLVAMRRSLENFEDVFLAGLLHDVGIVLEDQYDHQKFRQMLLSIERGATLDEYERNALGYSHTQLGALVGERWRFPGLVLAAIAQHHQPNPPAGEWGVAVRCVQVANTLCTLKGHGSVGADLLRPPVEAVGALNLTRPDLEALLVDLDEEFERNSALFAL